MFMDSVSPPFNQSKCPIILRFLAHLYPSQSHSWMLNSRILIQWCIRSITWVDGLKTVTLMDFREALPRWLAASKTRNLSRCPRFNSRQRLFNHPHISHMNRVTIIIIPLDVRYISLEDCPPRKNVLVHLSINDHTYALWINQRQSHNYLQILIKSNNILGLIFWWFNTFMPIKTYRFIILLTFWEGKKSIYLSTTHNGMVQDHLNDQSPELSFSGRLNFWNPLLQNATSRSRNNLRHPLDKLLPCNVPINDHCAFDKTNIIWHRLHSKKS